MAHTGRVTARAVQEAFTAVGVSSDELSPDVVDRMVHSARADPPVDSLLRWLCSSLTASGPGPSLSPNELRAYSELKTVGVIGANVLDGHGVVVEAGPAQIKHVPTDQLVEQADRLERENEVTQAAVRRLTRQCDGLTARLAANEELRVQFEASAAHTTATGAVTRATVRAAVGELAAARNHAAGCARTMVDTRQGARNADGETPPTHYLTQCTTELEHLFERERAYTAAVDRDARGHFDGGVAGLVTTAEGTGQFEWLALDDPASFVVLNGTIAEYSAILEELLRLRAMDEVNSHQEFTATVECARLDAAIRQTREACAKAHHYATEPTDRVRTRTSAAGSRIAELNGALGRGKIEFEAVAAQASKVHANAVLRGNHRLQLERQAYAAEQQDRVLRLALAQRARQELLVCAVMAERQIHGEALHLLAAFERRVTVCSGEYTDRAAALVAAAARPLVPDVHSPISVSDGTLHRVAHLLGLGDHEDVTYDAVYGSLNGLVAEQGILDSEICARQSEATATSKRTEQLIDDCTVLVYGTSSADVLGSAPRLAPKDVEWGLSRVQSHLDTLGSAITLLDQHVSAHHRKLAQDPIAQRSASLMDDFFSNPQRLTSGGQV
eukprot:m.41738 g.41738  ORF g.41738 m.41738 type:complete len:615 (-) comp14270_c0_seq1:80-1924(-)